MIFLNSLEETNIMVKMRNLYSQKLLRNEVDENIKSDTIKITEVFNFLIDCFLTSVKKVARKVF